MRVIQLIKETFFDYWETKYYRNIFLPVEKNWQSVALNSKFGAFRMKKREVSQDNKAPKTVSRILSVDTTNALYGVGVGG